MLRRKSNASVPLEAEAPADWEVLPGGMLVQKRMAGAASAPVPLVPAIRLRVRHGLSHHEIYISSQSTFGEVKKLLWEKTGMHPQEQRILFKERERNSSAYLDTAGVKDGSKIILEEDFTARAKRLLEMRRTAKAEREAKTLATITVAVDMLVSKVSDMEAAVNRGDKTAEEVVADLIEQLMAQLVRLDSIVANEGIARRQRGVQVRRVQRNVEKLDQMKLKVLEPMPSYLNLDKQQKGQPAVVTTQWESFDTVATAPTKASTAWQLF